MGGSMAFLKFSLLFNLAVTAIVQDPPSPHAMRSATGTVLDSPYIQYSYGKNSRITLYGSIDSFIATEFEKITSRDRAVKEVFVDLHGGEIHSAIKIARILRKNKMVLTVDGRCFSACANFLFMAAERKKVMKNSLIGIHDYAVLLTTENGKEWITGNEIASTLKNSRYTEEVKENKLLRHEIAEFYNELGIKEHLFAAFDNYVSNRKRAFDTQNIKSQESTDTCPSYDFWILNKDQLESIGAHGIEEFWFPDGPAQIKEATKETGIKNSKSLYFGTNENLKNLCLKSENSWFKRAWLTFIRSIN